MQPAIAIYRSCCILVILIVSKHDIRSLCDYLARFIVWIRTIDTHLHARNLSATRMRHEGLLIAVANNWSTLGHSVANGVWEIDGVKEIVDLWA